MSCLTGPSVPEGLSVSVSNIILTHEGTVADLAISVGAGLAISVGADLAISVGAGLAISVDDCN